MPELSPFRWRTCAVPIVLLLLSIVTTTAIGARFMQNFHDGLPLIATDQDLWPWPWLLESPSRFLLGWPFSLALLTILLSHEFGHYVACRRHSVDCTLPWVLPAPTLSGTFGAVIRLRSRIPDRRVLMDIGVWGPISGYVVCLIMAGMGIVLSAEHTFEQSRPATGLVVFHTPLTLELMEGAVVRFAPMLDFHHHWASELSVCHPVLLAAWIGFFITSLNLIPCGQLDGGHILYAISPKAHRLVSRFFPIVMFIAAWYCWIGWAIWGVILLIPAMRHPRVTDHIELDRGRRVLALFALVIFATTITAAPFPGNSIRDFFAH